MRRTLFEFSLAFPRSRCGYRCWCLKTLLRHARRARLGHSCPRFLEAKTRGGNPRSPQGQRIFVEKVRNVFVMGKAFSI